MFEKSASLKTSTCKCSVMDMAPPAGSRFVHIMTLTYSSIFTFLNVYCSPFPVFLKPPVGGELGVRSLPSLLAALIRDRAPMVRGPY